MPSAMVVSTLPLTIARWIRIETPQQRRTIRRLRMSRRLPPPLFSETRMAPYQHSGIVQLVCLIPFLRLARLNLSPITGEFLQSRTFRGLETRAGLDPPSILQQGRSGIARGYGDDH